MPSPSGGNNRSSSASLPPAAHAIAGAVGGALATWMFYPLELLRVEMQAQGEKNNTTTTTNTADSAGSDANNKNPQDEDKQTNNSDDECKTTTTTTVPSLSSSSEPESNLECFIRLYKKRALYRGASSMVTTMLVSSFITFYALEVTRRSMSTLQHNQQQRRRVTRQIKGQQIHQLENHMKFLIYLLPKSNMGSSLLASTLTGILNVFLTTPLWNGTRRIMESDVTSPSPPPSQQQQQVVVVQVQVQLQQPNLWEMMHQIAKKEGVLQLWHGTWSSLLLVSNPAIQYFLYEQIRVWVLGIKNDRQLRRRRRLGRGVGGREADGGSGPSLLQLTAMEAFAFGALSKTVATVVTYPLQLAQVLIRLRNNELKNNTAVPDRSGRMSKEGEQPQPRPSPGETNDTKEYNGMVDCLYQQYTRGGYRSLFQGMNSKLLQTVLSAAFTFLTYEQTLALVGKVIESNSA